MARSKKERRIDRSAKISEALDKLLVASVQKNKLLAAVLADLGGLLVASAQTQGDGERLAGVVSLVASLREYLSSYRVLPDLTQAELRAGGKRGMVLWPFEVQGGAEVVLAILFEGRAPRKAVSEDIIKGVRRIIKTRQ